MDDFKRQGGHLSGREERSDAFAGEPKAVGGTLGGAGARGTTSLTENEGGHGRHNGGHLGSNGANHNGNHLGNNGATGTHHDGLGSSGHNSTGTATGKKPSLMDKLNPKIDANGDGKPGFMS